MFFLMSCSWKEIVASYISRINSNFIVVEDVIQFFESNIKCFEYLKSFALNVLMHQSCMGELFYYKWSGFYHTLIMLRGK